MHERPTESSVAPTWAATFAEHDVAGQSFMSRERNYLFAEELLYEFLGKRQEKMLAEIDGLNSDYVLKVSLEDVADHLADKYHVEPVVLSDSVEIAEHGETQVDVSKDPMRFIRDPSKPFYVKATFATFVIPFEGEAQVFRCRPSTYSACAPSADVRGQEIRVRLTRTDHNHQAMRADFDGVRESIRKHVEWGVEEIRGFNAKLRQQAKDRLELRKTKFLADHGMVSSLGFPIRPRAGTATTYTAPVTRKKLPISKPAVASGSFKPEPELGMEHYEYILRVISNMVLVMERSPTSFSRLDEEGLRTHILVQLNGHYEGQATGETFNAEGKTDILIRTEGRNIFIAECKFWKGAEGFKKTIDQLLGYTAWRDTKTAIIVFNRNKDTSAVLKQIPDLVRAHTNFKREITVFKHESGFRFVLHHRDDKNRELTLTVLVFDVPS
jgi:hypothetical protein